MAFLPQTQTNGIATHTNEDIFIRDKSLCRELIMRGFALISRCAGLVGPVREEQLEPAMRVLWESGEHAVQYDGTVHGRTA